MKASDAIEQLCSALAPEILAPHEFELALGKLIAHHRKLLRRSREVEAASLPTAAVVERQGCHRATAYRRQRRGKKIVAALSPPATEPA
jgi:hypothetical protein